MFTVKAFTASGHIVRECSKYAFIVGAMEGDIALRIDRLELGDHEEGECIPIGADMVYVMNANGRTIDTFHQYPPDHPKRLALDPSLRPADYDERSAAAVAANDARHKARGPVEPATPKPAP